MTHKPRVTIDHDNTLESTFAEATSVELKIEIEFDHGDHEAALDQLTTATALVTAQLVRLRPAAPTEEAAALRSAPVATDRPHAEWCATPATGHEGDCVPS